MGAIFFEGPTLRSTKTVAMPTCTLHHDAGAPPCPSCETPHARTCAPWEGVETHEYDCVCARCREAWLLSDTDSEELFGVAMRSRSEEWEPNWSQEILTRGATSQEILDEWRPECWFREDQPERARSPALHPVPPHTPRVHLMLAPTQPRLTAALTFAGGGARRGARGGSGAGTPRPPAPLGGCFLVHGTPTARTKHAHCTLTPHAHCAHGTHTMRTLHANYTPTTRPLRAHYAPTTRPPTRPLCTPTANPLHAHCTHPARTGTAHTTSPTRRRDS